MYCVLLNTLPPSLPAPPVLPSILTTPTLSTYSTHYAVSSVVPARLGLKAAALAFSNPRPGQSRQTWLGSGLARPRPQLFVCEMYNFFYYDYRRAT